MRRSFLRWTLPILLVMQVGLLYIQGAQLHRQNLLLQDMHEDLQALLERFGGDAENGGTPEDGVAPAHQRIQTRPLTRVALRQGTEPLRRSVPWQRWALGSLCVAGVGLIALFRLRRRH